MKTVKYFTKTEKILWLCSVIFTAVLYGFSGSKSIIIPAASLIGITSLILNAKGNPAGQFLMIIFSLMYGVISFSFRYYGEMITYLGMTMPMAVLAFISWLRNPYKGNRAEVAVNRLKKKETVFMFILTAGVTAVFYFILGYFNTAYLPVSTLSVATSFAAVYLTFRRSPYYAVCYALNDAVLIVLWVLASVNDKSYIPVTGCFISFFANDIYGFISWKKMEKRQKN